MHQDTQKNSIKVLAQALRCDKSLKLASRHDKLFDHVGEIP